MYNQEGLFREHKMTKGYTEMEYITNKGRRFKSLPVISCENNVRTIINDV